MAITFLFKRIFLKGGATKRKSFDMINGADQMLHMANWAFDWSIVSC